MEDVVAAYLFGFMAHLIVFKQLCQSQSYMATFTSQVEREDLLSGISFFMEIKGGTMPCTKPQMCC